MTTETLSATLRAATADIHRATDRLVLAGEPFSDLDAYARFIAALGVLHRGVEAVVAGHPVVEASGHRPRAQLVEADADALEAVGARRPEVPSPSLASSATLAEIVGMLYVVEGSTLGGRHLARMARRRLGDGLPTRFLDSDGDDVDARWVCTRAALDASGAEADAACAAAHAMFGELQRVLVHDPSPIGSTR